MEAAVLLMRSNANKYTSLLSNTAVFAVGSLTVKIISFVLMPVYTTLMTEDQFGIGELLNGSIEILLPLVTLGIIEAVYRFSINAETDLSAVFSTAVVFVLIGDCVVAIGCILVASLTGMSHMLELWLLFVASSFYKVTTQFARGLGQAKHFAIYGIVNSITLVASTCILLGVFGLGIAGYMISFAVGYGVSGLIAFVASGEYRYILPFKIDSAVVRGMLMYSLPLVPNLVSWWLTNMSSRYVVLAFCGPAAAGLYAAASKLPSMLNMFTSVFQQAWQYSTATEIGNRGSEAFFSNVLRVYSWLCAIVAMILLLMNRILCGLLLQDGFVDSWHFVPLLLLAAAFGCLSTFFGTFYQALKDNRNLMMSTVVGAVICVLFTPVLVSFVGVIGASAAVAVSYLVILLMRLADIGNKIEITIKRRRILLQYGSVSALAILCSFMGGVEILIPGLPLLLVVVLSDITVLRSCTQLVPGKAAKQLVRRLVNGKKDEDNG